MSVNVSAVRAMPKIGKSTVSVAEPVFVFGSNIAGIYEAGAGAYAVAFHGAVAGKGSGMHGNSYAIPTHDSALQILSLDVINNYINGFLVYAANHSQVNFQVARIGCCENGYKDEEMGPLFRQAGPNCHLPGLWLKVQDSKSPLRIIIHDPDALLLRRSVQALLDEYFSHNLPPRDSKSVEIVSVGKSNSLAANDAYARKRKFRHRIIGANPDYYGVETELARNTRAVWYATHLVCFVDPDQTSDRRHVRLISMASRNGLMVDEVNIGK